jgi:hypothetical protein
MAKEVRSCDGTAEASALCIGGSFAFDTFLSD